MMAAGQCGSALPLTTCRSRLGSAHSLGTLSNERFTGYLQLIPGQHSLDYQRPLSHARCLQHRWRSNSPPLASCSLCHLEWTSRRKKKLNDSRQSLTDLVVLCLTNVIELSHWIKLFIAYISYIHYSVQFWFIEVWVKYLPMLRYGIPVSKQSVVDLVQVHDLKPDFFYQT